MSKLEVPTIRNLTIISSHKKYSFLKITKFPKLWVKYLNHGRAKENYQEIHKR